MSMNSPNVASCATGGSPRTTRDEASSDSSSMSARKGGCGTHLGRVLCSAVWPTIFEVGCGGDRSGVRAG